MVLEQVILPFFIIWGLFLILLLGRRTFLRTYRILSLLVFVFFLFLFWNPLQVSFFAYQNNFLKEVLGFLFALGKILPLFILFLWPFALILTFYKADDIGAEKIIKILSISSLFFLLFFSLYLSFYEDVQIFIQDNLGQYLK